MKRIARFLILALLACAPGQDPLAQQEPAAESAPGPADETSRETEINENNYRRFMELRDQASQRASAPYAVLAPPSNLEKMGRLPEASQKHLRNQLLGIMLEGGRWSPEEAGKSYPFVPSEAAQANPQLHAMEADAWSELVENYHARESDIFEAGARARSATVPHDAGRDPAPPGERGTALPAAESGPAPRGHSENLAGSERQGGQTVNALEYLTGAADGETSRPATAADTDDGRTPTAAPGEPSASAPEVAGSPQATTPAEAERTATTAAEAVTDQTPRPGESTPARPEIRYESPGVIALRDLRNVKGTGDAHSAPPSDEEKRDMGENGSEEKDGDSPR